MSSRSGSDAVDRALTLGGSDLLLHLMGCGCPGGVSGFAVGLLAVLEERPADAVPPPTGGTTEGTAESTTAQPLTPSVAA